MKVIIQWTSGLQTQVNNVTENCDLMKFIRNGQIFDSFQYFNESIALNMKYAEKVIVEPDDEVKE